MSLEESFGGRKVEREGGEERQREKNRTCSNLTENNCLSSDISAVKKYYSESSHLRCFVFGAREVQRKRRRTSRGSFRLVSKKREKGSARE